MVFSSLSPTRDKALLDKAHVFFLMKKKKKGNKERKEGRRLTENHGWPCNGTISFALETVSVSSSLTNPIAHADADARELSITAPGSNYQPFRPTEHWRDVWICSPQKESANRNTSRTGSQAGRQKTWKRPHTSQPHGTGAPWKSVVLFPPTYQEARSASLEEWAAPAT